MKYLFSIFACLFTISQSQTIELDFTVRHSFSNDLSSLQVYVYETDIPLINTKHDEMLITICLGTPLQCFKLLIDSGSFHLWVPSLYSSISDMGPKFDHKKSSTYVNTTVPESIQYGTGQMSGYVAYESLSLASLNVDHFYFLLAEKAEGHPGIEGILGLGYSYDEVDGKDAKKFSLIEQLYVKKLIKEQIFTQKFTNSTAGKMIIGELPDEIKSDMKNYGSCDTIKEKSGKKNSMWECLLKGTFFGINNIETIRNENLPALFDTGANFIVAPSEYLKYLEQSYFSNHIKQGKCKKEIKDSFFVFLCDNSVNVSDFMDVNFVLGEFVLKMKAEELFVLDGNTLSFQIAASQTINEWTLGQPLLKKFHMVFDKQNDKIGFYGVKDKYRIDELPKPQGFNWWYVIIFGLILLTLIILGTLYYCTKCRKKATLGIPILDSDKEINRIT